MYFFPIFSPWSSKRQSQNKQQAWELSDFAKVTTKNLCSFKWEYAAQCPLSSHSVVPKLPESSTKDVSKFFLGSPKIVLILCQSFTKAVSKFFHISPKIVWKMYKSCVEVVSKLFQSCVKIG